MLRIGVSATIGIAATAAASGSSISSSARSARGQQRGEHPDDERRARARPARSAPVAQGGLEDRVVAARAAARRSPRLGQHERLDVARRSTNHSHSARKPTPKRTGGQTPWKIRPDQTAPRPHAGPSSATGARPRSASRTSVIAAKNCSASRASSSRVPSGTSTICGDPPGPRRHHDHALGQEHRLGDRVRDEHDRRARLRADPDQLGLHALARHLVQRAERLVHQQQRRPARERAGDRHALLHAAGELARVVPGEVGEADELEQLERLRAALAPCPARAGQRQLDVALHRAPLEQPGLLEGDAVVLVQARLAGRLAVDEHRARRSARSGRR